MGFVHFVAEDEEGEVLGVLGVGLDEEVLLPNREVLEAAGVGDVVDQHAGFGAAVESHAEALVALLACRVPYLERHRLALIPLHDFQLFAVEICANGRLVSLRDAFPDVAKER